MGGSFGLTTINTFFEGTFSRAMGDDPSMIDQIFALGVVAFSISIILLIKDFFDGRLKPKRREQFVKSFILAGVLVLASLSMALISSDTVIYQFEDNQNDIWQSIQESTTGLTTVHNHQQIVINPFTSTQSGSYYYISMVMNRTTWNLDVLESLRGGEFNFSQPVHSMYVQYKISSVNYDLPLQFEVDGNGITWNVTELQAKLWMTAPPTSADITFYFRLETSNFDTSKSTLIDYQVYTENESELANFLIWIVMSLALYVPILTYLDVETQVSRTTKRLRNDLGL